MFPEWFFTWVNMTISIGIDIVSLKRFRPLAGNPRFNKRVFTESEISYSSGKRDPAKHLAGRFAVKEAFAKALGTGFSGGVRLKDIIVWNGPNGAPFIVVREDSRARELLRRRRPAVSICYSGDTASAIVAIE